MFDHQIGRYHDGELDERRSREVELHLAQCPACASHLAVLRRISAGLSAVSFEPITPMERARMWRKADRLPANLAERAIMRMAMSLAAVAALVLIVTSLWLLSAGSAQAQAQVPAAQIASLIPGTVSTNPSSGGLVSPDQANSNLSHWMVRNLGGATP